MAYAPMPQFVSIHGPKIGCNELPMATITEVLQSDSVKRLFNRQNVYLQNPVASSSKSSDFVFNMSSLRDSRNGQISDGKLNKKPELSVIPIMNIPENTPRVSSVEDKHLLPSKYEGKSGVALVPIGRERRRCGHYEPCESIVCDVSFQRYAEQDSVCPLIAVNIDASEIDAPVSKHCKSENCDALSIDHDRCRRAIVRCHRCDISNVCDICLVVLKTRKSQMNHKNCRMRVEYRHNRTSRSQILRDRMRQREVQILEAARVNKNDYTDPLTGNERAIESLHNNSELIVIPKTSIPVQQHPTIRITSIGGAALTQNAQTAEMYKQFFPRFPVVFPQQGILLGKRAGDENAGHSSPGNQAGATGASGSPNLPSGNGNPFITVTRMPRNFIKPVDISNLLQSPVQSNPPNALQMNPFLVPVRLVQTQGIPQYRLVPDTTSRPSPACAKPLTDPSIPRQPARVKSEPIDGDSRKIEARTEQITKRFKPAMRRGRRRKTGPKRGSKSFECTFCFKRFSTDWYFKLHIAKHKGEIKYTCKFCKKPFLHLYNMTKHVVTMHKKEAAEATFTEDDSLQNIDENEQSLNCVNCNVSFESITEMENHPCRIVCLRCNERILDGNLMLHLKIKHNMSDEKAVEEYEWQKLQSSNSAKNRVKTKREFQVDETQRIKVEETPEEGQVEQENGITKRKRHAIGSNEGQKLRRLTRRRNNSPADEIETILLHEPEVIYEEGEVEGEGEEEEGEGEEDILLSDTDLSIFYPSQTIQESVIEIQTSEDAATMDVVTR